MNKSAPCKCCGTTCASITFYVTQSCPCVLSTFPGVTITLKQGSTTIGTCVTNSLGSCTISVPSSGTYTYTANIGSVDYSFISGGNGTVSVTCPTNVSVTVEIAPTHLSLTDINGTITLNIRFTYGSPTSIRWYGCRSYSTSECVADCSVDPPVVGSCNTCYVYLYQCTGCPLSVYWNEVHNDALGTFLYAASVCTTDILGAPTCSYNRVNFIYCADCVAAQLSSWRPSGTKTCSPSFSHVFGTSSPCASSYCSLNPVFGTITITL